MLDKLICRISNAFSDIQVFCHVRGMTVSLDPRLIAAWARIKASIFFTAISSDQVLRLFEFVSYPMEIICNLKYCSTNPTTIILPFSVILF